jgi:Recombinase zinc beta ribbon domain
VARILDRNAARIGPKVNVSPLLRVLYCAECGTSMNMAPASGRNGQSYRYYRCPKAMRKQGCTMRSKRAEQVEQKFEAIFLHDIGEQEKTRLEIKPGLNYSVDMAKLADAIGRLSTDRSLALARGDDTSTYDAKIEVHQATLSKLATEETRADEPIEVGEGRSVATWWKDATWNGRNEYLRQKGVKAWIIQRGSQWRLAYRSGWRSVDLATGGTLPGEYDDTRDGPGPRCPIPPELLNTD